MYVYWSNSRASCERIYPEKYRYFTRTVKSHVTCLIVFYVKERSKALSADGISKT